MRGKAKPYSQFIKDATKVHGNNYEYLESSYVNSPTKMKIYCTVCNKSFDQSPNIHLSGHGCPICGNLKREKSNTKTYKQFHKKANKVHGNNYEYLESSYINRKTKMQIYCTVCKKSFEQRPNDHLSGKGCPTCGELKRRKSQAKDFNECIRESRKIHGNRYDYNAISYVNSITKMSIYCTTCKKDFEQDLHNHMRGTGCPICGNLKRAKSKTKTYKQFHKKADKVHDNKYLYHEPSYINTKIKTKIYCIACDKWFEQTPDCHLHGRGCPYCVHHISKPEQELLNYFRVPNRKKNRQVRIYKWTVDGMVRNQKIIYEFLGDFYHGNPEIFNPNDVNKLLKKTYSELYDKTFNRFDALIERTGYIIKYIWENDWKKFKRGETKFPKTYTYSKRNGLLIHE